MDPKQEGPGTSLVYPSRTHTITVTTPGAYNREVGVVVPSWGNH